jgi:hypothetical protein
MPNRERPNPAVVVTPANSSFLDSDDSPASPMSFLRSE